MRSATSVNFGGRYDQRPNPNMAEVINSSNIGRSRISESYRGYDGPLDSNVIDKRETAYPRVRRIADEFSKQEIVKSADTRSTYLPKVHQELYTYLDLSNTNAHFDSNTNSYIYDVNKYYSGSFSKTGLDKVYKVAFSPLSIPTYFETIGYDLNRIYVDLNLTEFVGNESFNYNIWFYPDNNASTLARKVLLPSIPEFTLNGYSPVQVVSARVRDISGTFDIPSITKVFTILAIGANTALQLANHGLVTGMRIFIRDNGNKKSIFPRIYPIIVIDPNIIEIAVDTSVLIYLIGQEVEFVIDDYVFNFNIKLSSIREDY